MSTVVLIVEDDEATGTALVRALKNQHFDVYVVSNGAVAEQTVRAIKIDVLVVDYFLPDTNGAALALSLRKLLNRRLPVVCLTGLDAEDLPRAQRDVFDLILSKPLQPLADLGPALRKVMQ